MSAQKWTPGPWHLSGPMGTGHLSGSEPWFWLSADRTLHVQIKACSDGYVRGENEANARLISAAPDMAIALSNLLDASEGHPMDYGVKQAARLALAKAGAA